MRAIFIVSTLIIMLQGCAVMTPEEAQQSRSSWAKNTWSQDTQRESSSRRDKGRDKDYLYYYIAHSYSNADIGDVRSQGNNYSDSDIHTESNSFGHKYAFNGEKSLVLTEIVSKMAEQLLYNFDAQYHNEAIAMTSLVDLNDHQSTNWLGQTISEQFIHELHIRNLRVVDFKLMGSIQVTEKGEFGMTRNWAKLNKNVDVTRILTGTMSRNEEGVILNIRIVNANTNLVESTSSAFIPHTLFVGGVYDYNQKQHLSRTGQRVKNKNLVRLVR